MKKATATELLRELIGEQTFVVEDHESNRFNFFGLIEVTPELVQEAVDVAGWNLTEDLPEDVKKAVDVMAENDVEMNDFTGIVRYENDDSIYYLLIHSEL